MRPIELLYKSLVLLFVVLAPIRLNCQDVAQKSISVSEGVAPIIDGKIEQREWQDAAVVELTKGGSAYLKHDNQNLYIGVRGVKAGWSHVYLSDGGSTDVSVIHASAAIGKSLYQLDEKKLWQPSNQFKWELRDNNITAETRRRMNAYLAEHGWVSSNNSMGNAQEVEFAIRRQGSLDNSLRMAIVYVADGTESQFFPSTLADDTLKPRLLAGNTPPDLQFNTSQWAQIRFSRQNALVDRRIDLEQERAALLEVHRIDRRAHFETDVDLLLKHSAADFISVSSGKVSRSTRAEVKARFADYFRNAKYYEWDDLESPIVKVSNDASMAWMIVRTKVRRVQKLPSGEEQERSFVYAGIMTYEKQEGKWVRVANVSTFE